MATVAGTEGTEIIQMVLLCIVVWIETSNVHDNHENIVILFLLKKLQT